MSTRSKLAMAAAAVVLPNYLFLGKVQGQVTSITLGNVGGGSYSQNFDTLPLTAPVSTNSTTFVNGTTIPGWYVGIGTSSGATLTGTDNGGTFLGGIYYYGNGTTDTDRSLGAINSNGNTGNVAYGAQFLNTTGKLIDSITITYTGEQWRFAGNNTSSLSTVSIGAQTLFVNYRVGGSTFGSPGVVTTTTDSDDSTFAVNHIAALDFNTPVISGNGQGSAVAGHAAANSQTLTSTVTGLNVLNNSNLWVRFFDGNWSGSDDGIAINNFQLTYTTKDLPGTDTYITNTGTTSINLGRTSINTPLSTTLHKIGTQQTGYNLIPGANSRVFAVSGVFDAGTQDTTATFGFNSVGVANGTIAFHNAASGSDGGTLGSNDPDDVVSVSATVVGNRFISATVPFGKLLVGQTPSGTLTFATTGTDDQETRTTLLNAGTTSAFGGRTVVIAPSATGSVLFNDASITETRGYTASFSQSGVNNDFALLDVADSEPVNIGETAIRARVNFAATTYQPAALTVSNVTGTKHVGDTVTITNADSDDNVIGGGSNFGARAGARILSLDAQSSAFSLTGLTGGPTGVGTQIGTGTTTGGLGGAVTGTVAFNSSGAMNGTYSAIVSAQFEHDDQTIIGTSPHDLAANDFSMNVQATVSATPGDHNGVYTFTGGTFVAQPNIVLNGTWTQSGGAATFTTLSIGSTGLAQQTGARSIARTDSISTLSIASGGKFDAGNNDLIIKSTPITGAGGIESLLASGGLTTTVTSIGGHTTTLGYATATSLGVGSFDMITVNPSDVLVRFTYAGDANLDGKVDTTDFAIMAGSFSTGTVWRQGDFNYDGKVNALDFNAIAANYGAAAIVPAPVLGALVPEPLSAAMLLVPVLWTARRRRV